MIRSLAALLLVASGWSWTGLGLDRLRWNERERSETGIESLQAGREQEALEAFETAARLDAEDPLLRFNAGAAHLATGSEGALPHLEAAAASNSDDLGPSANYNLGKARLAAGDTAGAIEAYEQALRLAPAYEDAAFNLELALRQQQEEKEQKEKEEQQKKQGSESPDQSNQNDQKNEQDPNQGDEKDDDQKQQGEQQPAPPDQQEQQQDQSGSENGEQKPESPDQSAGQLPQFEEQPDMTAEQAAAILEAVENLEREQRRLQAAEEMKKRPRKGKDW